MLLSTCASFRGGTVGVSESEARYRRERAEGEPTTFYADRMLAKTPEQARAYKTPRGDASNA